MSETIKKPIWTKSFIGISMTQLIMFMVFYGLITTLPLYVIHVLGRSKADAGLVVTVMLIAAIIARLFSAKLLDNIGKKRGLVFGVVAFALTTFMYIFIDGFIPLLIIRFIHGLSFGFVTTATGAIVANVVPRERHGEGIGYFAMASTIAVVIGPFFSLTLLQYVSYDLLFIVLNVIIVGAVLFAVLVQLPEEEHALNEEKKRSFSIEHFIETKAIPVSIIAALSSIAYASMISFVPVFSDSIGLAHVSSYFFIVYAAAMIISRPYFGKRFDRLGPMYAIIPGFLIFAIGLFMLSFTQSASLLLISAGIIGLGFGTLTPSFQTMAVQSTSRSRTSYATATFFTFFDVGIAIGSYILGFIVEGFGFQTLYVVCAIHILIVMSLFIFMYSKQVKRKRLVA